MVFNTKRTFSIAATVCVATAILTGCASNKWLAHYESGKAALAKGNAASLAAAEKELKTAFDLGERECPVDKQYASVIEMLGETLYNEGKFEESQWYLTRSLQLASAVNMPIEENKRLLRELVIADQKTSNFEDALATQNVLVRLMSVKESPFRLEYQKELDTQSSLKTKVASSAQNAHGKEAASDLPH